MNENSTVPTAIAFLCFVGLIVFFVFLINYNVRKEQALKEEQEAKEVGKIDDLKLSLGGNVYTIECESTKAVQNLVSNLPLSIEFNDLANKGKSGNIYFKLLSEPKTIKKALVGDVLLEGNSTIIIVDKSFKTSDKYTKIGHIENLGALPSGSISGKISTFD